MNSRDRPSEGLPLYAVVLLFLLVQFFHASRLGLSDDEAYYWVLAGRPALGYAYHPPVLAWIMALTERWIVGWGGTITPLTVRLPAIALSASLLALSLMWLKENGVSFLKGTRAAWVLLSFAGIYALSWLVVPDLPLFLGEMMAILSVDRMIRGEKRTGDPIRLGVAVTISILSKYSGILIPISACWIGWTQSQSPAVRKKIAAACVIGVALAALPILIFNARTGWGSLNYQLHGRHEGGSFSLLRWGRFWVIQVALVGPLLFFAFWSRWKLAKTRITQSLWAWALPPLLIYGLQPLYSEFKPHWALLAWFPFSLLLARGSEEPRLGSDLKFAPWRIAQYAHATVLFFVVAIGLHTTWLPRLYQKWMPDRAWSPLWDPSADLRGWDALKGVIPFGELVVGGRYQTAAQASFALRNRNDVTLLPRTPEQLDEWPNLKVTDVESGPHLSAIRQFYFVTDERYSAPPAFEKANCSRESRMTTMRDGVRGKVIEVYRCMPTAQIMTVHPN